MNAYEVKFKREPDSRGNSGILHFIVIAEDQMSAGLISLESGLKQSEIESIVELKQGLYSAMGRVGRLSKY